MISPGMKSYFLICAALLFVCAAYAPASAQFERIDESGIRVMEVEASLLNVEVNGVTGANVTAWGEDIPRNLVVKYKRRGDVLRVWVEKRFSPFAFRKTGRLYFEVPGEIELDIKSSSGEVFIRNINSQNLSAESSSGIISISNIQSDLRVKNSSGDINVGMVHGDIRAESSSGRIELIDVRGSVSLSASSGDIRLSAVEGDIEASSSSGTITLSAINGALDLETSSGDIAGEDVRIAGDSLFETSSGRIDIDLSNQLNDLSFRLTSSSGSLEVGDLRGEKRLAAGEGAIRITGESGSGDQFYQ